MLPAHHTSTSGIQHRKKGVKKPTDEATGSTKGVGMVTGQKRPPKRDHYWWRKRMRRNRIQWMAALVVLILLLVAAAVHFYTTTHKTSSVSTYERDPNLKYILYGTTFFRLRDFEFGFGQEPFEQYGCPVSNCYATDDRNLLPSLSDMDAVLFHPLADPLWWHEAISIASWRRPHQRFVFFNAESLSPPRSRHVQWNEGPVRLIQSMTNYVYWLLRARFSPDRALKRFPGFFNWTMTYHWNSDMPRIYGWFRPIKDEDGKASARSTLPYLPEEWIPYNEEEFLETLPTRSKAFLSRADRPKNVAWMVSNCNTPGAREDYVRELQKYTNVTILGGCGQGCKARPGEDATMEESPCDDAVLARDYKFYMALENSLCEDYVTEKFFTRTHDHVVIVYGGANLSKVAPPHSYIDALDYTPDELASYLDQLQRHPEQYLSYFWWQDHYEVFPRTFAMSERKALYATAMCRLCARLHETDADKSNKASVYQDLYQWFTDQNQCNTRPVPGIL